MPTNIGSIPASPITIVSTEAMSELAPSASNSSVRAAQIETIEPISLHGLTSFRLPVQHGFHAHRRSASIAQRARAHIFDKARRAEDTQWVRDRLMDYRKNATGTLPKLSEHEQRKERGNKDTIGKFIDYMQARHLFKPAENEGDANAARERFVVRLQSFQRTDAYDNLRRQNKRMASTALNELHDALFAEDLHRWVPRYRAFFAEERHAKWANNGLRGWGHIRRMENSRIDFLFDINRRLLDEGSSLLQRMGEIAQTRQLSWLEALQQAQQLEAEVITERRPERGYIQDFLEFYLNGPERYQPALPPTRDIATDTALIAGETPRQIAALLPDADIVASLRRKMFDEQGVAVVRHDAEYLVQEEGESIRVRCLGDTEGNGPFYQEGQYDNAQSCSAHAIGSFLNPACDIDDSPIALSLKEYRAEAVRARIDFEGGMLDGVQDDHPDFAAAVLLRMGALHKPVTFELLYFLTARQATHLAASPLSESNQRSLPSAQIAQINSYLDLIGFSSQGLQFFKGGLWKDSPDWPFLAEMIDGHASASDKMIIGYASNIARGIGHFVVAHRKIGNRKWVLVDSTKFEQPGMNESRSEWKPSKYLMRDIMRRADAFEVIVPSAFEWSPDADVIHNPFFRRYSSILAETRFTDAVEAMSAFCRHKVSKILFDEHRNYRDDDHDDERDGPVFDYSNTQEVDLLAIAEFLDASARVPTDTARAEVTDVDVILWQSVEQCIHGLNALRDKRHVDRIMLGGWTTAPYFVAATFGAVEHEGEPRWRVSHGSYAGQTLEAFFPQLIASLPVGSSLHSVDVLSLREPYRSTERLEHMPMRVAQWSTARMNWMVDSVRHGEQRLRDRLAAEQRQRQEQEAARAGNPREHDDLDLDDATAHDSDLDSLFNEQTPAATQAVQHALAFPERPDQPAVATNADDESVPVLRSIPPALRGTRAPSSFYRTNLENLIAGRASAPYPSSYQPKAPRAIAYARTSRQHVDPSRLSFRKGGMLNFLRRTNVQVEIDPGHADSILERFRVEAATDPRYAGFAAAHDLVAALNAYIQDVGLGHLPDNPWDEFNSQVRFFWARTGIVDLTMEGADGRYGEVALPLLVQMSAHDTRKPQKRVAITDMRPATQPNLISMILSRSARQWQFRSLTMKEQTARLALARLRSDCMRGISGTPPEERLASLEAPEVFLAKIQDALRRDDEEAAEVITARLWRVTIVLGEFDVRLLLTKIGNRLQDVHLDTRENRLLLLEQVNSADERRRGLINRLMDASDKVLDRFLLHLNNNSGGLPYSYFDALAAIERQGELDQLDDLPADYAPLRQLIVETPGGDRLCMLVLFEAGEAVDVREDADETTEQNRRDMLRLPVDAAVAANLQRLMARAESDPSGDLAADAAAAETRDLIDALAAHARALPGTEDTPSLEGAPVDIRALLDVLHKTVRRGTGEIIHPDYPDLKRYELTLTDASGEVRKVPVLIRLKGIDHPEDEDRMREIRPDTALGRQHMLAYQLLRKDLNKILAYDLGQNWRGTGHGPLFELAKTDYLFRNSDAEVTEDIASSRLRKLAAAFISAVVRRDAPGAIALPGFPDIARYPTRLRDEAGNLIYLIARVAHSRIRAVRLDTPAEFMNIALHKGDPGDYLQQVRLLLPPQSSADDLQNILQPANEDRDSISADYPAYSHFSAAQGGPEAALEQPQFVGRIEGRLITELAPAGRFGELAAYKVPVRFMAPIRAFDKRNNLFIHRHVPPGQTFWEFICQHVRRENKHPLPGFPQLGRYPVPRMDGGDIALVARVESGELWEVGEYNGRDQRVLRRMEKHIRRDLSGEARRATWHYERKLRFRRSLDVAIARVKRRQRDLHDPQALTRIKEHAKALVIEKAVKRDRRAEMIRLSQQPAIRPRQSTNMTALFGDEDLLSAVTDLLDEDGWEEVTGHTGAEILRKTNGSLDEQGEPLYLYAFMRNDRLRDVRVGNADGLQSLIDQRRREMATIEGTDLPHLPLNVVREIWSVDRYNGGLLIELADRAHMTFPNWLRSLISQPEMVDGRPVFKDGLPVLDRAGHPVQWLRRYPVEPLVNGRTWHLIGEFDADRDLEDPKVQIRLADAYAVPPDDNHAGYELSSSLRALWDYLATGAVAPASLPVAFDGEAVATPRTPPRATTAALVSEFARAPSRRAPSVEHAEHSPPRDADPFDPYPERFLIAPDSRSMDFDDFSNPNVNGLHEQRAPQLDAFPQGDDTAAAGHGASPKATDPQPMLLDPHADAAGIASNMSWDLPELDGTMFVEAHNDRHSPSHDPSMLSASAIRAEQRDARTRRGESLLRELEEGPAEPRSFLDELDWDALFEAMNEDEPGMDLSADQDWLQPDPSMDLAAPSAPIRQPVDMLLADAGIDRRSPSVESPASDAGPMIYTLHRIEYDNEDVIERVMEDLYDTHGDGVHDQVMRALAPNDDTRHLAHRFWYWFTSIAQPDRERTVNPKHPQLKAFSLGLLGDKGEPVCVLATVHNGLVGRAWVDNPKNEKDLIEKLDHELDERKSGFEEKLKPKTALSAKAADILAAQLKLSDSNVYRLRASLAAQALGSELLGAVDIEERARDASLVNAKKDAVFRAFLLRGFRDALMQPRSNARLLTIPTSTRDIDGSTLNIVATLRGSSIAELWVASTAKRQRRRPLDLVRQHVEREALLDDVPYINTKKRSRRRHIPTLDAETSTAPSATLSRKGARLKEVRSVSDGSMAPSPATEPVVADALDTLGEPDGGIVLGASASSAKRGIDPLLSDEPESSAKRQRAAEPMAAFGLAAGDHHDVTLRSPQPMATDNYHYAPTNNMDELASAIVLSKPGESGWEASFSQSPLVAPATPWGADFLIERVGADKKQFHIRTLSDSSSSEQSPLVTPLRPSNDQGATPASISPRTLRPAGESKWIARFGEAGGDTPEYFSADEALARFASLVDLNRHFERHKLCGLIAIAEHVMHAILVTQKESILNSQARNINLALVNFHSGNQVIYEGDPSFQHAKTNDSKLRLPSRQFEIIPSPVTFDFQVNESDASRLEVMMLAKYNNLGMTALESFFGLPKRSLLGRMLTKDKGLPVDITERINHSILNWPNKIIVGATRMQHPSASDDVLFVRKGFKGISHTLELSTSHKGVWDRNKSVENLRKLLELNGSMKITRLSTVLGQTKSNLSRFFKEVQPRRITNEHAYVINKSLSTLKDGKTKYEVLYEDENFRSGRKIYENGKIRIKPRIFLPSRSYQVIPAEALYRGYKLEKSDSLRWMLYKLAKANNLTFHGLGVALDLTPPRILERVMIGEQRSMPSNARTMFLERLKTLREQNRVINDGRTRLTAPDAPFNVIFLPDDFTDAPFRETGSTARGWKPLMQSHALSGDDSKSNASSLPREFGTNHEKGPSDGEHANDTSPARIRWHRGDRAPAAVTAKRKTQARAAATASKGVSPQSKAPASTTIKLAAEVAETPSAAQSAWAAIFGEEKQVTNVSQKYFTAEEVHARWAVVFELNPHLSDSEISRRLCGNFSLVRSVYRSKRPTGVSNQMARKINTNVVELAEKSELLYENQKTIGRNEDISKRMRWPHLEYKILPNPVNLPQIISENDSTRMEIVEILRDNNITLTGFVKLIKTTSHTVKAFGARDPIPDSVVEKFNQAILTWPKEKFIIGYTRMQKPEAGDDIIFIRNGFKGIPFSAQQNSSDDVIPDNPDENWRELIRCRGSMPIKSLSALLGQKRNYLNGLTRTERPRGISNEAAYSINSTIFSLKKSTDITVLYADDKLTFTANNSHSLSSEKTLILPSKNYKILPTFVNYDNYKFNETDKTRKILFDIAQASNMTFYELGTHFRLSSPRTFENFMRGQIRTLTPNVRHTFITSLAWLRTEKRIICDGSTRKTRPDVPGNVVFLPDGFDPSDFEG